MKKFIKSIALTLTVATAFALTGCFAPKYEALSAKDFKKALESTLDYEEGKDFTVVENAGDIEKQITVVDEDVAFMFIEFDKEKHALKYFEKEFYDDYKDMLDDKEFEGKQKNYFNEDKYTGYCVFDGENDDGDEIYGGVYLKDKTLIIAMSKNGNKNDKKDVKALIDAIEYPSI